MKNQHKPNNATKQLMSECPICMEVVEEDVNSTITACKHKFHTTCLLTNVSKNGYKCPNCRGLLLPEHVISEQSWYIDRSGNYTDTSGNYVDVSRNYVETHISSAPNSVINSIIEIIHSEPYRPNPRFDNVSSNSIARLLTVVDTSTETYADSDTDTVIESFEIDYLFNEEAD